MTNECYHPGLEGVIAGETAISAIDDGLRYRGYSIEERADFSSCDGVALTSSSNWRTIASFALDLATPVRRREQGRR